MASSSTSSIHKRYQYDVFLSFRGEDTRKNFVDHLYDALERQGIRTFKDDERLKKGTRISEELLKSIQDSKFFIIVFSKNYASSSWCLDELVKIMECHKTNGQNAYPVFYDVDPSEVRKQSGVVEQAFAKFNNENNAGNWRDALKQVADLSGWNLRNTVDGHEAKVIKLIVEQISLELRFINLSVDDKLVGMETRIKDVESYLEIGLDDVRVVGIKGMGGGGKTTLARATFDKICMHFEGKSFVENVREVSQSSLSGLKSLQEKVLSDVLNEKGISLSSVHEGKRMMKKRMCGKKVLVVLDDVHHIDQLEALVGEPNWFKPGSRIIITTRDEQVLVGHRVNLICDVSLLSDAEAIWLFSRYAFGREVPIQGYEKLSRQVVRYAAGLPLTIRVLGSFLCGKNISEWNDALQRLTKIPLKETLEKLELSYMSLEDDYKEIFLDVACLLEGQWKDDVIRILHSCGFHAINGLRVLEQKSLITFNKYGLLCMHDHIKEMGRNIVRRKHPNEPNKHSRLWIREEIEYVLANDLGTKAARCIEVYCLGLSPEILMKGLRSMMKLRLLVVDLGSESCSDWNFDGARHYFPNALRYLKWGGYPFQFLPKTFQANDLVTLEMPSSQIIQLWEGGEKKVLNNLKYLDLSFSKLTRIDIGLTPNLEVLNLEKCHDMEELHMGVNPNLSTLYLSHSKLKTLKLGFTPNLEQLALVKCQDLVALHFPINYGCTKLTYFKLTGAKVSTLDLRLTLNLERLELQKCDELVELHMPARCLELTSLNLTHSKLKTLDLGLTPKLTKLTLCHCNDLVKLHMPIIGCAKLTYVELSCSKLRALDLTWSLNLEELYLRACDKLVEVHLPIGCTELKTVHIHDSKLKTLNLGRSLKLEKLTLFRCHDLVELHMHIECPELNTLHIEGSKLKSLHLGLSLKLKQLTLLECHDLVELHMLDTCPMLASLELSNSKLKTLDLGFSPNLKKLDLQECHDLVDIHLLVKYGCPKLTYFKLTGSKWNTLDLTLAHNLQNLTLTKCHDMLELRLPVECRELTSLYLDDLVLKTLDLSLTPNLKQLTLAKCHDLVELRMLVNYGCPKLTHLNLVHSKLKTLDLGLTPNLEKLTLMECHDLVELHMPVNYGCPKLTCFELRGSKLNTLDLKRTPNLQELYLGTCDELVELHMPIGLQELKYLYLDRPTLKTLDLRLSSELKRLNLTECDDLVELYMPFGCPKLTLLKLYSSKVETLDLGFAPKLNTLMLTKCHDLVELQMHIKFPELRDLYLCDLKLKTLDLVFTPKLEKLTLNQCHDLVQLYMPNRCPELNYFELRGSKLKTLDLGLCPKLKDLRLEECHDLLEFHIPVNGSPKLKNIELRDLKLKSLDLGMSPNLKKLRLEECHDLVELHIPVNGFPKLKDFELRGLKLKTLNLGLSPKLKDLRLEECHDLVELHIPVNGLPTLKYFELMGSKLKSLDLGLSPKLGALRLEECHDLKTLKLGLSPCLESLSIAECHNLVELRIPDGCLKELAHLDLSSSSLFESFFLEKEVGSHEFRLTAEFQCVFPLDLEPGLQKFQLSCVFEKQLCSSTGNLQKFISLGLCHCTNFNNVLESICGLPHLRELKLKSRIPETLTSSPPPYPARSGIGFGCCCCCIYVYRD